ncbi:hypothetical protein J4401_00430 [Candidatus Woesearchaeota archaeon]|nr:hypothetical protein [Candidatus Woesearchaeota archaeon]
MKKAQIQMMETIAALFIFLVIIAVSIVFYFNISSHSISEKKQELAELSAVEMQQLVLSLPELQCTQNNVLETNCIDIFRLDAASKGKGEIIYIDKEKYFSIFGQSKVSVKQIYPISTEEWVVYESKPARITSKSEVSFPVSLYEPGTQQHSFGLIMMEAYR